MNRKNILMGALLIFGTGAHSNNAFALGDFRTNNIADSYILSSSAGMVQPSMAATMIENYIRAVNPKREERMSKNIKNTPLAMNIAGAAFCFDVDPFVLTAVMRVETGNFNQRALSPTGAVGFGQFTTTAMQEIWDQLGQRGTRYARADAIEYFQNIVRGQCLTEYGAFQTMGANYVNLWETKAAKQFTEGSRTQAFEMTKLMATLPETAIVYAAMLMKINLAITDGGRRTGCSGFSKNRILTARQTYEEAVMAYNGEHCPRQLLYKSQVFNDYYPAITGVKAQ